MMGRRSCSAPAATRLATLLLGVLLVCTGVRGGAAQPLTRLPEPSCNTNVNEGFEVWSKRVNSVGPGAGEHWWGKKAAQTSAPLSWIDHCAQRLEVCQADSRVAGSASGFKKQCVCDMWTCLNKPPRQAPAVREVSGVPVQPACTHVRPYLLNYYCNAARSINATCAAGGQVPLPVNGSCPVTPADGFTFDDLPGDGVRIPDGYQGLHWDNWVFANGDNFQVPNGYYAGVVSSPNVAFNSFGYPATVAAPEGALLTLHSVYVTSAWDEENLLTITAEDEAGEEVGSVSVLLNTDAPALIDLDSPPTGRPGAPAPAGRFAGVKAVVFTTRDAQVAIDNLALSVAAAPGKTPAQLPQGALEFHRAAPGASSPSRKPQWEKRESEDKVATSTPGGGADGIDGGQRAHREQRQAQRRQRFAVQLQP